MKCASLDFPVHIFFPPFRTILYVGLSGFGYEIGNRKVRILYVSFITANVSKSGAVSLGYLIYWNTHKIAKTIKLTLND
jgi:hypothetical protein